MLLTYTYCALIRVVRKGNTSNSRVIPVASKFPQRVRDEVKRLAKEKEWSLSKTILHLTERGLAQVNGGRQDEAA